jgi:putative transposase
MRTKCSARWSYNGFLSENDRFYEEYQKTGSGPKSISALYKKLTDFRQNYLHQISNEIVKTKPSRIIMENLNIKGMMKNKYLAKSFSDQKLFELTRQIKYKCENYGIEFMQASRWFPRSKLCSCCGHKKFDLKLNDRVYHCNRCELVIDRDYNASINLATYTGQW